jgi:hypothetical protein
VPSLRDKAHDGVLCTFSDRTSATGTSWICQEIAAEQLQTTFCTASQGRWHGPSFTAQISPGWVTLFQPARRASVLGHLSSLRLHVVDKLLKEYDEMGTLDFLTVSFLDVFFLPENWEKSSTNSLITSLVAV